MITERSAVMRWRNCNNNKLVEMTLLTQATFLCEIKVSLTVKIQHADCKSFLSKLLELFIRSSIIR